MPSRSVRSDEIGLLAVDVSAASAKLGAYRREAAARTRELAAVREALAREEGERRSVEARLQDSEERYALVGRAANDGLWSWEYASGRIHFSPRWVQMLGLEPEAVTGHPAEWFDRVHPEDLERVRARLDDHLRGATPYLEVDYRMLTAREQHRWMLARAVARRDSAGRVCRIAGSQTDIHDRKTLEEKLRFEAFHDRLTGLPNRTLFLERLRHCLLKRGAPTGLCCAVLFLDLDRFEVVNDSLGHRAGDALIVEVAGRLRECLREGDTVARLGADEFVILLERPEDPAVGARLAERILEALARPFELEGREILPCASIGIAFGSAGERPDDVLHNADLAMVRVKTKRAACRVFEPGRGKALAARPSSSERIERRAG